MIHFERETENLKKKIFTLGAMVEEELRKAVKSLTERDTALAEEVIRADIQVDEMEIEVEEDCLKILALYQPKAFDLRFIIAVLKMNNELERIGDLAVNIAERVLFLNTTRQLPLLFDFPNMMEKAQSMLKRSMDALVNLDAKLAREICSADAEVDAINREMYQWVKKGVDQHPEDVEILLHLLSVSRQLERIGDHATNIAEDVIYMVEGRIARHSEARKQSTR